MNTKKINSNKGTNPNINLKLIAVLLALSAFGMGLFYAQFSKEVDALKAKPTSPVMDESSKAEPSHSQAPSIAQGLVEKNDPFKAFLEAKAKNPQLTPNPTPEPSFVPGTDPFKAKLEEQKNAAHSAVSPFKN